MSRAGALYLAYPCLLFPVARTAEQNKVVEFVGALEVTIEKPKRPYVVNGVLPSTASKNVLAAVLARSIVALPNDLDNLSPVWTAHVVCTWDTLRNTVALCRAIVSGLSSDEASIKLERLQALCTDARFGRRKSSPARSVSGCGPTRGGAKLPALVLVIGEFLAALFAMARNPSAGCVAFPGAKDSGNARWNPELFSAVLACTRLWHRVSICKLQ